jgi:hypothetical protein
MPEIFKLPEYEAAVRRESNLRNASFLGLSHNICGCRIKQVTLWHWIILDGIESPFTNRFTDKIDFTFAPTPEQILMFLWVLSPEFWFWHCLGIRNHSCKFINWRRKRFIRHHAKMEYPKAVTEIAQFMKDTFQDLLPWVEDTKGLTHAPFWSYGAALIHAVASRYGWTRDMALQLPLKELFQYQKIIDHVLQIESGQLPITFNNSDSVKRAELTRIRSERAEREKAKIHPGQQVAD